MANNMNQAFVNYFHNSSTYAQYETDDAVCIQFRDSCSGAVLAFEWFDAVDVANNESAGAYVEQLIQAFEEEHKEKAFEDFSAVSVEVADFEGGVKHYYSALTDSVDWDGYKLYLEAVENCGDREMVDAGLECGIDLNEIEYRFAGRGESDEDFIQDFTEETGGLDGVPSHIVSYIDWEKMARDAMIDDFVSANGYYFFNR